MLKSIHNKTVLSVLSAVIFLHASTAMALEAADQPLHSTSSLNFLTQNDYAWIGSRIYQNECAGQSKYLTHWGEGEEFPSFGIGHFIWFPKEVTPPYTETFPLLVQFVSKSHSPPVWLHRLDPFDAPWNSKKEFEQAWSEPELNSLREWLSETKTQQAEFIVSAFKARWKEETARLSFEERQELESKLAVMMAFREGLFSVIDYFNFKGIGSNPKEQYQGETWGLVSVLRQLPSPQNMPGSNQARLELFVESAKQRLLLRTQLAPKERNESRWLKGWYKRLDGYLLK
ncbi:hypothetical protein QCB45_01715 [Thiomicrorhabdus sp. ZW0627]|uniref:hypothetical protein n=1 Tax=Thiomicrorhabdus sp. ZW0627 TaxID=3039774 RepID=UPI0024362EE8|nr:hypothetical protein [Thiomicrorhabdus sp. ZW0627]MDG6773033.1 hypothetical protein [Thiomicrorhabdus sp. ZW0627]